MEYYRYVYRNSPTWDGQQELDGKTVIVYGEQGHGDVIQFARYIPALMAKGCRVVFHCQRALHRLFRSSGIGHEWLDRECPDIPSHDFHIPIMSLPFLGFEETPSPYLRVDDRVEVGEGFHIGIAWEGNPNHTNNLLRSCRLSNFRDIHNLDGVNLYMLAPHIYLEDLADVDDEFNLYSSSINDFYDIASLINSMDMIISVDTAVLHVAGGLALNHVYGLLSTPGDYRWSRRSWYPNVTLLRDYGGDWSGLFRMLRAIVFHRNNVTIRQKFRETVVRDSILITGGIGDFLALESHMSEEYRDSIKRVYLATRANEVIGTLLRLVFKNVEVVQILADYRGVTFFQKSEVSAHLQALGCPFPKGWDEVEDWSILVKFPEIAEGVYKYTGTSVFGGVPYGFVKEPEMTWLIPGMESIKIEDDPYYVIFPVTDTESGTGRDFDQDDWDVVLERLEKEEVTGIVLAGQQIGCPPSRWLYNLSGETGILETITYIHRAVGYLGIDSFPSILAAQKFSAAEMVVKSRNPHLYKHAAIYYAPHDDTSFIIPSLRSGQVPASGLPERCVP